MVCRICCVRYTGSDIFSSSSYEITVDVRVVVVGVIELMSWFHNTY